MVSVLPVEIRWRIYEHLDYGDVRQLSLLEAVRISAEDYIQSRFGFHSQVSELLDLFESNARLRETAVKALELICERVVSKAVWERKTEFNELLNVLQQLTLERLLTVTDGGRYARLCLEIRSQYLATATIRALHDPKYRRRSTKSPLAPFLPRAFLSLWRDHCAQKIGENQTIRTRFARYLGALFDVTSLDLESCLDSTFDECVREALVTENAHDLLVLCFAAGRPVDIEAFCRLVSLTAEQLTTYLQTMAVSTPTPHQALRLSQQPQQDSFPEWLIPNRYTVHEDTLLRFKLMHHLLNKGWRWFLI